MQVRDEDPAPAPVAPEPTGETPIGAARSVLRRLLDDFVSVNSQLPATREFLRERGLTHVDQLDLQGKRDLVLHLEQTLMNLRQGQIR